MSVEETSAGGGSVHLSLLDLTKVYPGESKAAVDGVSLSLEQGKLLALLGPSGCGKTTTLRMIAGLIETSGGRVEVDGQDLTHVAVHRRNMGMVFQSYALFPHLDVAKNVAFGLEMRKRPKAERARLVEQALDMVQLGHLAKRRVKALSGGQQQRIALARALVVEPSVLLLDEPLSNLDAKLREAMRAEIRSIVHRLGVTTVFVTHDQDEALSMADVIAVMSEGRVEQVGTPEEIYQSPSNRFVADFIGRANLLHGAIVDAGSGQAVVEIPHVGKFTASHALDDLKSGDEVTVLIRPHHIRLGEPFAGVEQSVSGLVTDVAYTGDMVTYTVKVGELSLASESLTGATSAVHEVGDEVSMSWTERDALVLPESGADRRESPD